MANLLYMHFLGFCVFDRLSQVPALPSRMAYLRLIGKGHYIVQPNLSQTSAYSICPPLYVHQATRSTRPSLYVHPGK
jgi:hypothetical protein